MTFARIAFGVCVFCSLSSSLSAQDRMPPIPAEKMTPAQKKAAEELIAGKRGALGGPFISLLRSPEFMSRLQKTGEYLRYESSLEPKLNEFVILLTARRWTQQYEWSVHFPLALKAGLKPELLAAVEEGREPDSMSEEEETVYDFLEELHQNHSVSDATYARAIKRFGEQGIIDMVGVTGYYTMLSMIMNVARTPMPEGNSKPLAAFPH